MKQPYQNDSFELVQKFIKNSVNDRNCSQVLIECEKLFTICTLKEN